MNPSIRNHLPGLALRAVRCFLGTFLFTIVAGIVLASISYYFIREHSFGYALLAAALALIESVIAGVVLGGKRAIGKTAAHGLGSLGLGRTLVQRIFEKMLGDLEATDGQRGGMIRHLEKIPLAQAEDFLSRAIRMVTGDGQTGWLRGLIQSRLLAVVQKYTLARFREEGAKNGAVDFIKVKEGLEQSVDAVLVRKVERGLRFWTVLLSLGLPILVALQTWGILQFLAKP